MNRNQGGSREAALALGKIKDPQVLTALINRLKAPGWANQAAEALAIYGPEAEKEVVKLMNVSDFPTRIAVDGLLQKYGTKEEVRLTQTIADLASTDQEVRRNAVTWLWQRPKVDEAKRPEVAKALNPLLGERDLVLRGTVLNALEKWGATKDNTDALVGALQDVRTNIFDKGKIITLLGKSKDERAAKPLADKLEVGGLEQNQAVNALKELGAAAEPAVKSKLTNAKPQVRRLACQVLAEIGTRDSLGDLKRLATADPDRVVQLRAKDAVTKIEAREKK